MKTILCEVLRLEFVFLRRVLFEHGQDAWQRSGQSRTPVPTIRRYAPYEDACPYGDEGYTGRRGRRPLR